MTRLTGAGCVQVVLLTCGMDTRAFRLDWPPDTRVFEVDFAEVLAFRDTGHPLRPPPDAADTLLERITEEVPPTWPAGSPATAGNPPSTTYVAVRPGQHLPVVSRTRPAPLCGARRVGRVRVGGRGQAAGLGGMTGAGTG
ncbi:MAG: class I SAM-dependent methyltransferase [Pseudonocardiaceae bacterium]